MYALSFDMNIADLQQFYGEPYNGAYYEIKRMLEGCGFYWVQGSTYMTNADELTALYDAIDALREKSWFCQSVRDIRGYRVEQWSDFTPKFKK